MKGTVKWFNPRKNFGFIEVDGKDDHFVHDSEIVDGSRLQEDDEVEFAAEQGEKGPQATNVQKV